MEDNDGGPGLCERGQRSYLQLASLEQVRSKISMNNHQLLELTHHDEKLQDRIHELNHQGVTHLHSQNYQQALLFFQECERTLEYAASCGRTIDRSLILTVLNNQACAYQRLQLNDRAGSYVQAIIYNLNMFLTSSQNEQLAKQLERSTGQQVTRDEQLVFLDKEYDNIKALLIRKYQLAIYLLQFSGLNSQNQCHEDSLKNATKSLTTWKELFKLCYLYQSLLSTAIPFDRSLLKQLSLVATDFGISDRQQYESQLKRLLRGDTLDNNRIQSEEERLNQQLQNDIKNISLSALFTLQPKDIHESILETEHFLNNYSIEIASSYYSHLKKILFFSAAFFAVSVEFQQLISEGQDEKYNNIYLTNSKLTLQVQKEQKRIVGQLNHVVSLIIVLKYIPFSNCFTEYLLELFKDTYNSQILMQPPSPHKLQVPLVNSNMDRLKQKYKNYLVQKEISISLEPSQSDIGEPEVEQKKQSRKLNSLFKTQCPTHLSNPGQYISDLPSTDSIEMANSASVKDSIKMEPLKSTREESERLEFQPKKNKIKFNQKFKQIGDCQSQLKPESCIPTPSICRLQQTLEPVRDTEFQLKCKTVHNGRSKNKSKSTNKKSKSKGKNYEFKRPDKTHLPSTSTTSFHPHALANTLHQDKSDRSLKKNNQLKGIIGSAGPESCKWVGEQKKTMGGSEQIKQHFRAQQSTSSYTFNSIKMNKVKSPKVIVLPIATSKTFHPIPIIEERVGAAMHDKSNRGKSKNGKSGSSWKSKKGSKSKSLSNKKSLTKTIGNSKDKDKKNPSVYQTIKRR